MTTPPVNATAGEPTPWTPGQLFADAAAKDKRANGLTVRDVYHELAARRTSFDSFRWQAPLIAITGQAFLFTIILGANISGWARLAGCILSAAVSVTFLVILDRIRNAEHFNSEALEWIEKCQLGYSHFGATYQDGIKRAFGKPSSSHQFAMALMWVFLGMAMLVFVVVCVLGVCNFALEMHTHWRGLGK